MTTPAEVHPLASFVAEEMQARGWSAYDLAAQMPGDYEGCLFVVTLVLSVQDDGLMIGDETFAALAVAFGVSETMLRNLDAAWRDNPAARVPFTAPDRLFEARKVQ